MNLLHKWWKPALAVALAFVALQLGVSLLVRTKRARAYLSGQLTKAFGRPVEVRRFSVQLLPAPELDAEQITVGEDPGFGNEYFLRADNLAAGLRWTGLLLGHFEFGTLSLSHPSLTLVRNSQGRWNLEQWLPPAKTSDKLQTRLYGPPLAPPPANRLFKIEFDEGRVNFKFVDEKLPFALTSVSGSVDQVVPGRWQLHLDAQPWRSGVVLQSVGTLFVNGEIAGTSARLQPAHFSVHWERVSLADLFRLLHGTDYGVRGVFTLDGSLESGASGQLTTSDSSPGDWQFSVQARAAEIHRWDLIERSDNPRVSISLKGLWNAGQRSVRAEEVRIEAPRSNLRGVADYLTGPSPTFDLHLDSAGIQASDLLAWYRAFHTGVDDGARVDQYFTGALRLRGWPLRVETAAFSSNGGAVQVPALNSPLRIGPVRFERERESLVSEPVRFALGASPRDVSSSRRTRPSTTSENSGELTFSTDLNGAGSLGIEANLQKSEEFLKAASALGYTLNHGWEVSGGAIASLRWSWQRPALGKWNGHISFSNAKLAVAGLNQPLAIQESTMNWKDGLRSVDVAKVSGFGADWSGSISERELVDGENLPRWNFNLAADHLTAAELDHWAGPRARPNWLQRLLSSLLGGSSANPAASDLVRQIDADGRLAIGELTIEKIKLTNVRADGSLRDLRLDIHDADAQWAGGAVHAQLNAAFSPLPKYEVIARLDRVNLAQLPPSGQFTARLSGLVSGSVHLTTEGVGRVELLRQMAGGGELYFKNVELRGWDVAGSLADGALRSGTSRWTTGQGAFTMRNRVINVDNVVLESGPQRISLQGSVSFARDADVSIESLLAPKRSGRSTVGNESGRVLKLTGPLDEPRFSLLKTAARQPAD
ncbi:MAG TPA: AsmA family protein [Candidatus Acidoferrum sp.]|nr:AsmA family protein [Candidatus Acidoferrum sp.]